MTTALLTLAAVLLDAALGESRRWHPLVGFGRWARYWERAFNPRAGHEAGTGKAGGRERDGAAAGGPAPGGAEGGGREVASDEADGRQVASAEADGCEAASPEADGTGPGG